MDILRLAVEVGVRMVHRFQKQDHSSIGDVGIGVRLRNEKAFPTKLIGDFARGEHHPHPRRLHHLFVIGHQPFEAGPHILRHTQATFAAEVDILLELAAPLFVSRDLVRILRLFQRHYVGLPIGVVRLLGEQLKVVVIDVFVDFDDVGRTRPQ